MYLFFFTGNRLSTVSSQTTTSSAQDELNMAFENARRRLARKPVSTPFMRQDSDVYYSPYDSLTPYEPTPHIESPYSNNESSYSNHETPYSNVSQRSDNSSGHDSGIRQFTQSPPDVTNVTLPSYKHPSNLKTFRLEGSSRQPRQEDSSSENTSPVYSDVTSVYV